jgi:hypothetical protein
MAKDIRVELRVDKDSPRPLLSHSRSYLYRADLGGHELTVEAVVDLDDAERLEPGQSGRGTLHCLREEAALAARPGIRMRVWYGTEFADAVVL